MREALDETAERAGFSGVVRIDRSGRTELSAAYGLAEGVGLSGPLAHHLAQRLSADPTPAPLLIGETITHA